MKVNNSEVDLTFSDMKVQPPKHKMSDVDDRTVEDDIAIAQAVFEAEEELKRGASSSSGDIISNLFWVGVAVLVAAIFLNQTNAFSFLK